MFFITNPNQEDGVREEGEGSPDSSPQGPPDTVSPTPGLGEIDDDPLLDDGEVDMRAVMVASGVMEFELLRLPPQSKTAGPWTFQQGEWGQRRGRGRVGCALASHHFTHSKVCVYVHTHTMCASCIEEGSCVLQWAIMLLKRCVQLYSLKSLSNQILCVLPPPFPLPSTTLLTRCCTYYT